MVAMGLQVSDETWDVQSRCFFEVIDEGKKGRGIRYVGIFESDDNSSPDEEKSLYRGDKVCFFGGEVLCDHTTNGQAQKAYQQAKHDWRASYIVEYAPGVIISPLGNSARDVSNVAFLVNSNQDDICCNVHIGKSKDLVQVYWRASRTIRPGDILIGFYG